MPLTPEAKITLAIKKRLRDLQEAHPGRLWFTKLHGGAYQRVGLPDLLIIACGRAVFLEVKAPGGQLTEIQSWHLKRLTMAGAIACVVRSADEAEQVVETAMGGARVGVV